MNPLSAPISALINKSIRCLYSASSAELFMYTIVTQVNGVSSYVGWILKEEEFEDTNFVKILQLTLQTNHLEVLQFIALPQRPQYFS